MNKKNIYLFANWKMYLDYNASNQLAEAIAGEAKNFTDNITMAVFPSALAFYSVGQVLSGAGVGIGAQNVYWVDKGGYTGEVSAQMYKDAGCRYVLVGHSERRHQFNESNDDVRKKIEAVLSVGLTPVLCVGETHQERADRRTEEVIKKQLYKALADLVWPADRQLILAYEPVWAISKGGVGTACDQYEAARIHRFIKQVIKDLQPEIKPVILYGGSARPNNVKDFLAADEIDGVLVGGASVKLDSWLDMVKQVSV